MVRSTWYDVWASKRRMMSLSVIHTAGKLLGQLMAASVIMWSSGDIRVSCVDMNVARKTIFLLAAAVQHRAQQFLLRTKLCTGISQV